MSRKRSQVQMDEQLSAYLDGELSDKERARLEARLGKEPELRQRLTALRRTVSLLQELPAVEAPRHFLLTPSMVRASQPARPDQGDRPAPALPRWLAPALTFVTAASALLCVVALMGNLLTTGLAGLGAASPAEPAYEVALEAEATEEPLEEPTEEPQMLVMPAGTPTSAATDAPPLEQPELEEEAEEAAPPEAPTLSSEIGITETEDLTRAAAPPADAAGGEGPPPTDTPMAAAEAPAPAEEEDVSAPEEEDIEEILPAETHPPAVETMPGELPEGKEETSDLQPVAARTSWTLIAVMAAATVGLAIAAGLAWRARRRER